MLPLPILLLGGLLLLIYLYLRRNYGTLEKGGFNVVPTIFCFGSGPFQLHKINLLTMDQQRSYKYGKTFGAYALATPWVYTSDPEIIKQITVKDADFFNARQFTFEEQKYRSLDTARGDEWRELRKGLSPIFTSGKIKGMTQLIDGALDNTIDYLLKKLKTNPVIDMKPVFQCMTMDVIAKVGFGIDLNCFQNPDNFLFRETKQALAEFSAYDWKSSMMNVIIQGLSGVGKVIDLTPPAWVNVWNFTRKIQTQRANDNTVYGDFLDRLKDLKAVVKNGVVTEDQLTAQGIIFLVAGFETTATTLGSLTYCIVKDPEVYDTLMVEVEDVLDKYDGAVNQETIAEMPYLEACIRETLRMYPPMARNDRMCTKDWNYKNFSVKEGTCVGLQTYVVHHNPEYWPEPQLFKPERFLKENLANIVPYTFLPFGSGPRTCIGERFAFAEIKITMVRLLQHFHFECTDKTRMKMLNGNVFLAGHEDIYIKLTHKNPQKYREDTSAK